MVKKIAVKSTGEISLVFVVADNREARYSMLEKATPC